MGTELHADESFFARLGRRFKSFLKSKWAVPVGFAILFGILLGVYFLFSFKEAPTSSSTPNAGYWKDYRNYAFRGFQAVLFVAVVIYGIVAFRRRKLTYDVAVFLIALCAFILITTYSFSTPIYDYKSTWNQHDVYYGENTNGKGIDSGGGHFGMIMTIFRTGEIPQILKNSSGEYDFSFWGSTGLLERYHPKTFYFVSAYFMHFMDLFIDLGDSFIYLESGYELTVNEWALYESLRILYVFMECVQVYFIYKIYKILGFKDMPLLIAFALTAMCPMWCYFANWTNNDGMYFFFSFLSFYFMISFYKKESWKDVILCALFMGLGVSCKLGGGIIAFVAAPLFIYMFIRSVVRGTWKKTLFQGVAFILICGPIALAWPIYNNVMFGQDIFFFSSLAPTNPLYIHDRGFVTQYLLYPNEDVFKMIWVYHHYGSTYLQDSSLIVCLIKTALYGEYGFGLSQMELGIVYVIANILFVIFVLGSLFVGVTAVVRRRIENKPRVYCLGATFLSYYGWNIYFVERAPYTCNMDFRYVPLLILPFAGVIGGVYETFDSFNKSKFAKEAKAVLVGLTMAFAFFTMFAYLTLSPWYYR